MDLEAPDRLQGTLRVGGLRLQGVPKLLHRLAHGVQDPREALGVPVHPLPDGGHDLPRLLGGLSGVVDPHLPEEGELGGEGTDAEGLFPAAALRPDQAAVDGGGAVDSRRQPVLAALRLQGDGLHVGG
ncbi:MAG: hypothetical protein GWM92_17450 [Gemmatimonadetes bacterium]|nr:hypothetical protein [Gemmatimonadota bacterium]NIR80558.1 hypothetical protein [Gemmatimonadota bacterium]NIT89323.1 hypothetical protein [Gemmatimonadota bacterium]NIU33129.1 hypothetical protein [Gemmatimonadota bacterium]NIU37494.1 hypothetical protein [Gemmatimonadota bacterium]